MLDPFVGGNTSPQHDNNSVSDQESQARPRIFRALDDNPDIFNPMFDMVIDERDAGLVAPADLVVVGLILSNGVSRHDMYKCHVRGCTRTNTFKRLADLKRHNASRHNRQAARFWCPVDGYESSMKSGGRAFPRKDKIHDHLERVHAVRLDCEGGGSVVKWRLRRRKR